MVRQVSLLQVAMEIMITTGAMAAKIAASLEWLQVTIP
jgi:hypothetical protein